LSSADIKLILSLRPGPCRTDYKLIRKIRRFNM
jgi:hypothetical protein